MQYFGPFPLTKPVSIRYAIGSENDISHARKGICPSPSISESSRPVQGCMEPGRVSPRSVNYLSGRCWTSTRVVPRKLCMPSSLDFWGDGGFLLAERLPHLIGKDMVPMKNFDKYRPGYYLPPEPCFDWAKKDRLTAAPQWCSVDQIGRAHV